MVVFLEPLDIETAIHTSTGSIQLVPGMLTSAGDRKKLHNIISPANTVVGGAASALPICLHPYMEDV